MIEMHGYMSIKADACTVKDLRDLVKWLDDHGIEDSYNVGAGSEHIWITIADTFDGDSASMIECADHLSGEAKWDVLLETHKHKSEKVEYQPGWDWVRNLILPDGNKYGDDSRPE